MPLMTSDVEIAPGAMSAPPSVSSSTSADLTALAPTSGAFTSPLMMSSEPTWFWPGSGPSMAYAVPLRATNNETYPTTFERMCWRILPDMGIPSWIYFFAPGRAGFNSSPYRRLSLE